MQPIYEFGGAGPILHVAVANGFPPEVYKPLIWPMTGQFCVVSLPPRALWPDETPPEKLASWRDTVAVDLLQGIRDYNLQDVVAVGHSFGAIATILAAVAQPHRFKALILLDPTILTQTTLWIYNLNARLGIYGKNPLAERAGKRRDRFESTEAAYENFKPKRLFADWPDETVRLYAEAMRPAPDGEGVMLAWPRAWEAYYFNTLYTGIWRDLPKLRGRMPILLIRGATSDTFSAASAARLKRVLPEITYVEVPGHGHLFPQSAPNETRKLIQDFIGRLPKQE